MIFHRIFRDGDPAFMEAMKPRSNLIFALRTFSSLAPPSRPFILPRCPTLAYLSPRPLVYCFREEVREVPRGEGLSAALAGLSVREECRRGEGPQGTEPVQGDPQAAEPVECSSQLQGRNAPHSVVNRRDLLGSPLQLKAQHAGAHILINHALTLLCQDSIVLYSLLQSQVIKMVGTQVSLTNRLDCSPVTFYL